MVDVIVTSKNDTPPKLLHVCLEMGESDDAKWRKERGWPNIYSKYFSSIS